MSSPVDNSNFKTIAYIKHPSMTLLVKFHGHIVKTFFSLPAEGTFLNVVKRIALVVVSPLAYLALACIGLLGYPYTTTGTKQVPIQVNTKNTASLLITPAMVKKMTIVPAGCLESNPCQHAVFIELTNDKKKLGLLSGDKIGSVALSIGNQKISCPPQKLVFFHNNGGFSTYSSS